MNNRNVFEKLFDLIDLVGDQVNILFNGHKRVKSSIGGVLTLLIIIFIVYCCIYYGEDLINKKNPITRFSKETNSMSIPLTELSHAIGFVTNTGVIKTDIENYLDIRAKLFIVTVNNKTLQGDISFRTLIVERCTAESYGKKKDIFTDPKNAIPYTQGY